MSNKDKKKPEPIKWKPEPIKWTPGPKLGDVVSNDEEGVKIKLTAEGEKFFDAILPRNAVVQGKPTIGRA